MRPLRHLALALVLAIVTVHYSEESLLPAAEKVRALALGERSYSQAFGGCEGLSDNPEWVHPAALALTVYGTVQATIEPRLGAHEPEVLPSYRAQPSNVSELKCIADYLLTAVPTESVAGLRVRPMRYQMAEDSYALQPGWVSGLAQGVTGQVMLAAYLEFGDSDYFDAARQIGNLLRVPIDDGGVLEKQPNGGVWFAEYAQAGIRPPLVLNGHLLALDFLYRMDQVDPENDWGDLFAQGVRSTAGSIDQYSGRFWSYYDRYQRMANHKYHRFHVRQLQRYSQHDSTGRIASALRRMQWQQWLPLGIIARLIRQPSNLLIFLTTVFTVIYFSIFCAAAYNRRSRKAAA